MSAATQAPAAETSNGAVAVARAAVVSWKAPIAFGVFALLALVLFVLNPRAEAETGFRLSTGRDFIQIPDVVVPSFLTGVVITVALFAIALWSAILVRQRRKTPLWAVIVFAVLFMVGFLAWAAAGETVPVPGLLIGTVSLSVPLIFGAMAGVISERGGVVNIAIEGQLLSGAFTSALIASVTNNPYLGLLGAAVAGLLVSFVLGAFAVKYFVDQIIVGVVLNVLVIGLTSFLYSKVLQADAATLNSPERFARIDIPVLSGIPIIGPVLFSQTIIVYVMYVAVAVIAFALFKTRWGLRLRSVGEHPTAADTVGINVAATRFWNVSLGGAIAGFGGAYFTLGSVGAFQKEMTAGMGFIALAAVIFGKWHPVKATFAALLFGFATNLKNVLGVIGSPVPSEFMLMLPYVVTVFAVAGLVGVSRAPAADGKPYIKS
ncbi:ABC transporter permease [Ruicaihuangia caeni]|uniref:ABC transporter permease n=1 Tax=Ruicaihuangia caeni TaxID=3042517 RepID=UPI00338FFC03